MHIEELEYEMEVGDFEENTLLLFTSETCEPCHVLLDALYAKEDDTEPHCYVIEVSNFPDMARSLDVKSLPTVMYISRGVIKDKASGEGACFEFINDVLDGNVDE